MMWLELKLLTGSPAKTERASSPPVRKTAVPLRLNGSVPSIPTLPLFQVHTPVRPAEQVLASGQNTTHAASSLVILHPVETIPC